MCLAFRHDIAEGGSSMLLHLSVLTIQQAHKRGNGAVLHQPHLHLRVKGQIPDSRHGVLQYDALALLSQVYASVYRTSTREIGIKTRYKTVLSTVEDGIIYQTWPSTIKRGLALSNAA